METVEQDEQGKMLLPPTIAIALVAAVAIIFATILAPAIQAAYNNNFRTVEVEVVSMHRQYTVEIYELKSGGINCSDSRITPLLAEWDCTQALPHKVELIKNASITSPTIGPDSSDSFMTQHLPSLIPEDDSLRLILSDLVVLMLQEPGHTVDVWEGGYFVTGSKVHNFVGQQGTLHLEGDLGYLEFRPHPNDARSAK